MNQQFAARRAKFPEKTENLPLRMLIHFAPRKSALIASSRGGSRTRTRDNPHGILRGFFLHFSCVGLAGHLGLSPLSSRLKRPFGIALTLAQYCRNIANIVSDLRRICHPKSLSIGRLTVCETLRRAKSTQIGTHGIIRHK